MFVQKLWVFRRWDLYKCNASKYNKGEPLFQVRKNCRVPKGDVSYQVTMRSEKAQASFYRLEGSTSGESAFKIIDSRLGELVAEVSLLNYRLKPLL